MGKQTGTLKLPESRPRADECAVRRVRGPGPRDRRHRQDQRTSGTSVTCRRSSASSSRRRIIPFVRPVDEARDARANRDCEGRRARESKPRHVSAAERCIQQARSQGVQRAAWPTTSSGPSKRCRKDETKKDLATDLPQMWKAFSDLKFTVGDSWAAGDYVAATESFDGTNDGDHADDASEKDGKEGFVAVPRDPQARQR